MTGPTIHNVVMDERTNDLTKVCRDEIDRHLTGFRRPFANALEEALRQAYVRGVRDGFQQGALAAEEAKP